MFRKRSILERWKALYDNGPLERKLREFFRDPEDLRPEHLRCLLVVVTRNATTDSAWPISSNPWAKYNERDAAGLQPERPAVEDRPREHRGARVLLARGDPVGFGRSGEVVRVRGRRHDRVQLSGVPAGADGDGAAYGLGWPRGERKLGIVSIGTGSGPVLGATADEPNPNIVSAAVTTLSALMSQALFDQDINCRTVGRCVHGPPLDREVGDLVPRDGQGRPIPLTTDLGRAFLYARYNAELTRSGLTALGLPELDPAAVSALDSTAHMDDLVRIGEAVAGQVELAHFGALLEA